ncbi:pilus assembly protein (plasmid) [Skermanella sp. TT6]|uniref:Pilus assembly protein n=1 Tax=Skermanella cutis TaxID=2775420 RepID=A0ABX7BGC5_9PROT|nr:TadE/TadG family type IV pilus assembly protein [Skermanella sp. TT6]QQP93443.1 pilus assembly protein [Skermanella sp. TT6]
MTGAAKTIRSAIGSRRGVAALEFAVIAPVLILLLVGMVDMTRYALAALRLERAASGTADVGTQFDRLRDGMTVVQGNEVGVLFLAAAEIARPLDLAGNGAVIITCVADQGGGPVVMWQRRSGRASAASGIGGGGTATLPAGFTLRYGESVLFVEVQYTLHPYVFSIGWLAGSDEAVDLRRMAVYRPRFGTLTELER